MTNNVQAFRAMQSDPREFRRRLLVDTDDGPRPLADVADDWQREDFQAIDNGIRRVVGAPVDESQPTYQRAWLERPRGHSKTSDLATTMAYLLFASARRLSCVCVAADQDQARLLRTAVQRLVDLNAWLRLTVTDCDTGKQMPLVDVQRNRVRNASTGSSVEILSSDVASSWGILPDAIICDELCHWSSRELVDSLLSSAAKRRFCTVVIITNAGFRGSWQWELREVIRSDPAWYFSRLEGPTASWLDPAALNEQRRLLPPKAYQRLWENQWQSEAGDALDTSEIEQCVCLPGPMPCAIPNHMFIASLDLGIRHDHSALVTLGIDAMQGRIKLASVESWAPSDSGGRVSLSEVEAAVLETHRVFGLATVVADPWQSAHMCERLRHRGLNVAESPITVNMQDEMATLLLSGIHNRTLAFYRDHSLLRDMAKLSILQRPNGRFKLVALRDESGHADRAFALCQGLPTAFAFANELQSYYHNEPAEVWV